MAAAAAAFESSKRLIRCQVARDLARINAIRDISHSADIIATELFACQYQPFRNGEPFQQLQTDC